jgi:hypothetical protein
MQYYRAISFGFSVLIMLGMTLDGWAHAHGVVDDTFLTPWHALLYAGLVGSTLWYGWLSRQRIAPSAPHRIGFALLPIVVVCGAADAIWHTVFGFEIDIAAQMSPPHIVLAGLIATLVAIPSTQRTTHGTLTLWGAISGGLAATMMLTLTQFMSPLSSVYAETYSGGDTTRSIGVTGFIIFVAVWLIVLMWMQQQHAPRWAFLIASVALGCIQAIISDDWRFVALLAASALIPALRYSHGTDRTTAVLWVACFSIGYFLILMYAGILMWGPTMWGGTIVMAIAVAYGLSALPHIVSRPPQGGLQ